MKVHKSLDGIISYLTRKHGGNVHEKGIVTITSKSVDSTRPDCAPQNVADLTTESYFYADAEPDQWICWDFGELRVYPTHYTIKAVDLMSWLVEGSVDGESWVEIDRRTGNRDFSVEKTASFPVSASPECRLIRVTQTEPDRVGWDNMWLYGVEFFGTVSQ
jgi:hypothetical protein